MSTLPNTARQSAEILLQGAANFVDATNRLMVQQQLGLQAIQQLWPERYEASKETFLKIMDGHAELLYEVLQEIDQAPGTLMVSALDNDTRGEYAGFGLDTDTGEYNALILPEGPQGRTPTALPLTSGQQLSLE